MDAPSNEYEPAGLLRQADSDVALASELYVPAGHCV
jgi:hypothetical protein